MSDRLVAAITLGGCAVMNAPTGSISQVDAARRLDWRTVATVADRDRIRDWYGAWQQGLRQARAAGHGGDIDGAGRCLVRADGGASRAAAATG